MLTVTWRPTSRDARDFRPQDFDRAHLLRRGPPDRAERTTNYVGASVRIMDKAILSPPHDTWGAFQSSKLPEPAAQTRA